MRRRPAPRRGLPGRAAAPLLSVLLLAACATVRPPAPGPANADALSGRLSVRVEPAGSSVAAARAVSAVFELSGDARRGELALSSSFGTLLARARWQPGEVTLATPQGESHHADLDALTRAALGEPLPVAALFDWLRGRPWPGADSTPTAPAAAGFSQLGWVVDLSQFAGDALVVARRPLEPPVTVRVKLDRP